VKEVGLTKAGTISNESYYA